MKKRKYCDKYATDEKNIYISAIFQFSFNNYSVILATFIMNNKQQQEEEITL